MTQHLDDSDAAESIGDSQTMHTRRGVVLYEESPFLNNVKTRTKRVSNRRGDMMLVNASSGEIQSQVAGFWESKEIDSASFIKLFVSGVRALAELTSAGSRVFEVLYLNMQKSIGTDEAYLSYTGLPKGITMGRSTFARGVSELIDRKFIAPQPKVGWYWINPDYVFNGDRLAFVKEYRIKGTAKRGEDQVAREQMEALGQQSLLP
jgi:hypothetical protein